MTKDSNFTIPTIGNIQTPLGELQLMADFANTSTFTILKRWARRVTDGFKNKAFSLNESDPQFTIKHARLVERAVGMELLIRAVENAAKELEDFEKK